MLLKKTDIEVLPDNNFPQPFTIKCPKTIYSTIRTQSTCFLSFGKQSLSVNMIEGKNAIEISETIAELISFPTETMTLQAGIDENSNTLVIGPVFAALAAETSNLEEPFGTLTTFFEEMARYCSNHNIFFYVFSLKSYEKNTIHGFRRDQNQWKKSRMPFPHAIYNRIPGRKQEKSDETKLFFKTCNELDVPYFNERFLNKWEVYNVLFNHAEIAPHLPESILYRKASDLDAMIQRHVSLYLKPIHGSLGRRIMRIQNEGNEYKIEYSGFSNDAKKTSSLLALLKIVIPRVKKQNYIIQQGIQTISFQNRPIDFRILCNKDETGQWKVTSAVARVSAENNFVSNLAMGGSLYRPEEILAHLFEPKEIQGLKKLLLELALQCVEIIDQESLGTYGEFGVDLAVDTDGKPWLLEINTKPSKTEETIRMTSSIRPSAKAIVNFAFFLSGFENV